MGDAVKVRTPMVIGDIYRDSLRRVNKTNQCVIIDKGDIVVVTDGIVPKGLRYASSGHIHLSAGVVVNVLCFDGQIRAAITGELAYVAVVEQSYPVTVVINTVHGNVAGRGIHDEACARAIGYFIAAYRLCVSRATGVNVDAVGEAPGRAGVGNDAVFHRVLCVSFNV